MNSFRFGSRRTQTVLVAAVLLFGLTLCDTSAAEQTNRPPAKWVTLADCKYMPGENSDGDSFHVQYGQREFIFRLYFVDAPETDAELRDRVREQAQYFGVTTNDVLKAGVAAKEYSAAWLKQSLTIQTRWQNALGRSRLPRYYALVTVGGQDLAELLVRHGLGRAKGTLAVLPDGTRANMQMTKLKQLEAEAKTKRLGLWAKSKPAEKPEPSEKEPDPK